MQVAYNVSSQVNSTTGIFRNVEREASRVYVSEAHFRVFKHCLCLWSIVHLKITIFGQIVDKICQCCTADSAYMQALVNMLWGFLLRCWYDCRSRLHKNIHVRCLPWLTALLHGSKAKPACTSYNLSASPSTYRTRLRSFDHHFTVRSISQAIRSFI